MTKELEKDLVEFYLAPNSARETERKYGVNIYYNYKESELFEQSS